MNATFLVIIAGALLFFGMFFLLVALFRRGIGLRARVLPEEQAREEEVEGLSEKMKEMLIPLGKAIPRSEEKRDAEQHRLVNAGYRGGNAVWIWYGSMIAVGVTVFLGLTFTGVPFQNPILSLMLPVILGMMVPDMWLRRQIGQRKHRIQMALPDMMDLAVVCVEAGMGLDQTLQRIGHELRKTHTDLSDELRLYNLEVSAGLKRQEALRNFALRTDVDDVKALTGSLIQTDRFGTSIADSLRVFSDTLRVKRRQRAEEQAAKMNVKIVIPLVLFIFPAIFAVVAGPAVIGLIRELLPLLAGQ